MSAKLERLDFRAVLAAMLATAYAAPETEHEGEGMP